jgi:4-aminobutyrate aminotransferase
MKKVDRVIKESEKHREMGFCFVPLVIRDADGCYIEDIEGKKYLDFASSVCTHNIGYGNPEIKEVIKKYCESGIYKIAGSDFYCEEALELAKKSLKIVPKNLEKVFFVNSGAEAVENALKLAYRRKGPYSGVSCMGAFHGRTIGALTFTHSKEIYKTNFPTVPHHTIKFCRSDDDPAIGEFENILKEGEKPAFIILEPVQGEGGYYPAGKRFMQEIYKVAKENDIAFVLDEVQSGMGRTGKWWAHEHYGVRPDLMASAKSFSVGATFTSKKYEAKECGAISSTWGGGHRIDMVVSTKVIEIIKRDKLMQNATKMGKHLMDGLLDLQKKHQKVVVDVRGLGLMIGFELRSKKQVDKVVASAFKKGLILMPCGEKSIRIAPPMIITEDLANTGLDIIGSCVDEL